MLKQIKAWLCVFAAIALLLTPFSAVKSFAAQGSGDNRIRIAVLDFKDNSEAQDAPASAIQDMFTGELAKDRKYFAVIERARLDAVAKEQKLGAQGLVDASSAAKLGKILGVKYMVTGSITEYFNQATGLYIPIGGINLGGASEEAHVTIDLRVFDTQTSEVIYTARETGVANQSQAAVVTQYGGGFTGKYGGLLSTATYNCSMKLVRNLRAKMYGESVLPVVLQADGKDVTINEGSANGGVKVGSVYIAYIRGRAIKDIDGKVLDREKMYVCAFKIKEVSDNHSIGTLIKGKGISPRRGIHVENAPKGWKEHKYLKEEDIPNQMRETGSADVQTSGDTQDISAGSTDSSIQEAYEDKTVEEKISDSKQEAYEKKKLEQQKKLDEIKNRQKKNKPVKK